MKKILLTLLFFTASLGIAFAIFMFQKDRHAPRVSLYSNQDMTPTDTPPTPVNEIGLSLTPVITPPFTVVVESFTFQDQAIKVYSPGELHSTSQLIIYSHGSNEHVDPNLISQQFSSDLDRYGNYFAQNDAFFVASEMHGENWGSQESREHVKNLIDDLSKRYGCDLVQTCLDPTKKIFLLGFSMGGLPTLRFAKDYPEKIEKIALIAPSIYIDEWNQEAIDIIKPIPITIWHGTQDKNVPLSLSQSFFQNAVSKGHTSVLLNEIEGEYHHHFVEPEALWNFFSKEN